MNIKLNRVKLKNFLSFGNKPIEYEFESNKIVNIKGANLDKEIGEENGSSNGAGKTTLYQAIIYALYGKGIYDIKQDDFINLTNEKDLLIELNFEVGDKKVRVVRTRKPNALTLEVNGEDETRDSLSNTNRTIERLLGMNYETFVLTFLMTTSVQPLLSRKASEQRDFIEKFLGMDVLTERAKNVKSVRSDLEVDAKVLRRDVENAEEINRRERQNEEKNKTGFERFESDRDEKLKSAQTDIDDYAPFFEHRESYIESIEEYEKAKKKLEDIKQADNDLDREASRLETQIANKERSIASLDSDLSAKRKEVKSFEVELEEVATELSGANKKLEEIAPDVDLVAKKVEMEEQVTALEDTLNQLLGQIETEENDLALSEEKLKHIESGICPTCDQHWSNPKQKKSVDDLKEKIETLKSQIDEHKEQSERQRTHIDEVGGVDAMSDERADEIIGEYEDLQSAKQKAEDRVKWLSNRVQKTQAEIDKLSNTNADALKDEVYHLNLEFKEISIKMESLEEERASQKVVFESAKKSYEDQPFNTIHEVETMVRDYERAVGSIDSIKNENNPFTKPEDFKTDLVDVEEIEQKLVDLEVRLKHCAYLIKLLTDSKSFIRKNIVGRYVPYLNKMINTFADRLGSPHTCEIQPDLTTSIEYMRRSVSYHNLSAGERLKLDISASMALRSLLAMIGVKSDFLMVDEMFDSALDKTAKRNVFNLIKEHYGTVMMISHTEEFDGKADKLLKVVKQNGFSRLESLDSP